MTYTTEQIEVIAAKLREMPPADTSQQEYSKQAAIKILSKDIDLLKKRGYTMDQIADTLRHEGIDIATPTLKNYLQRARTKPQTKTTQKTRMKPVTSTQETTLADAPRASI